MMTEPVFDPVEQPPVAMVDACGLECPLPILKAKKALSTILPGAVLQVITTDRKARADFEAFCRQTGNTLLAQIDVDQTVHHYLRRRG
jgi:tRNA 2-thiouridine synthesizing protein A